MPYRNAAGDIVGEDGRILARCVVMGADSGLFVPENMISAGLNLVMNPFGGLMSLISAAPGILTPQNIAAQQKTNAPPVTATAVMGWLTDCTADPSRFAVMGFDGSGFFRY